MGQDGVYGHYTPNESAGFADAITAQLVAAGSQGGTGHRNSPEQKGKGGADDPI